MAAVVLGLLAGPSEAGTLTFREGDGKGVVSQTDDTRLSETSPDSNYGSEPGCTIDQDEHQHCVLKLPGIIGYGVDQIPPGSRILSATLSLYVEDAGAGCPLVYPLTEGWVEAEATWNSRQTAVAWSDPGADGPVSRGPVAEGVLPCAAADVLENVDVTRSVQAWSDGEANQGWVFVEDDNNGVDISTSEHPTFAQRPQLTVSFVPTVFYSVGTAAAELQTGAPTVSISGGVATLSVPQTGPVGVGDVIDHDLDNKLVYISSVLSPTRFQVQRGDGSAPTPVSGVGVNSIKRAFNSIAAAVSGSSDALHLGTADLAGSFRRLHWVLYDDGPFDVIVPTVLTGYTTAADYFVTVTVAGSGQVANGSSQRHGGVEGTGARLRAAAGGVPVLAVDIPFTRVEWLEIDGSDLADVAGIALGPGAGSSVLRNLIVHSTRGTSVTGSGVHVDAGADDVEMHNLVVYDYGGDGVHVSGLNARIANSSFYLGRSANVSRSIQASAGASADVYNVLALGPDAGFQENDAPGLSLFHCISTDDSAETLDVSGVFRIGIAPAAEFVSLAGPPDLHLRVGASAIDFGTDLSGIFTDDIDGQARPLLAAWDVGADETAGTTTTATHYRSIGTAPDLADEGTITVTAGSPTVTKVGGLGWRAENRGRGDVLVVGPDSYTVLEVVSDDELTLTTPAANDFTGGVYTIARQFTTLEGWEDCISGGGACPFFPVAGGDLVLEGRSEVGVAYRDSVFLLAGDVVIDGSTTDAFHTITLTADPGNRHQGVAGAGVVVDGQNNPNGIVVRDDHVTLEWLEIVRVTGANDKAAVLVEGAGQTGLLFQNLLIHDFFDSGRAVAGIGLDSSGAGGRKVTVRNTMIWDGDEEGIQGGRDTDTVIVENCSIDDIRDSTAAGIDAAGSTVAVINTVVTRSGSVDFDPDLGSFAGSSNNISSDGTAPGANALTLVLASDVFVAPGVDLHLRPAPNPAVDSGVDLLPGSSFRGDVDGQLRPFGPDWDRGADEFADGAPDLALTKDDGQALAVPGTPVSYAITVTNNGPDAVSNVIVTDPVPPAILGASFATLNGSYDLATGRWTFASPLFTGQSAVLTLAGTIAPGATGMLTNTATVDPPPGYTDPVPGNNSATDVDTLTPQTDLTLTKVENADPIGIGNRLVYTLTVSNLGPSSATAVVLTDTLVSELEFQSAIASQGSCGYDVPSRTLTCNLGVVAPATPVVVTLAVRPLLLGTFGNTATVVGAEPDTVAGNNTASETTTVDDSRTCVVTTDIGGGDDTGTGVAVQTDGRVVVGGRGFWPASGGQDFAAARYTAGLRLDGSFDLDGVATMDVWGEDHAESLLLQSDGRVLLGGSANVGGALGCCEEFALGRLDPDGSPDTLFGAGTGRVRTDVGPSWDVGRASALQADGRILQGGFVDDGVGSQDLALVRFNPDGSLDTTFNPGGTFGAGPNRAGMVVTAAGPFDDRGTSLAVQPDGRILLAGATWNGTDWDWLIVRYNPDGSLDGSFGGGGIVTDDLQGTDDWAVAVLVQPDGRIVVAGHSHNGTNVDFAVARYDANGSLDTASFNPAATFGSPPYQAGRVFKAIGDGDDRAGAGTLQPDGRIVVVGVAWNGLNDDFAMIRLEPDGSLDAGFGVGGVVTTAVGGDADEARAVTLQPDGRILVAGASYNGGTSNWDFALARYSPAGRLDAGCGGTHYRSIGTAVPDAGVAAVTAGSTVVTGTATLWQSSNRGRGDVITLPCPDPPVCAGGTHYTVLRVDSDTQLTLTEPYAGPTAAGLGYLIRRQFTTLQDWEGCISGDGGCVYFPVASANLVADNRSEVGIAYKDSVFALTDKVEIDGSTTDALHSITLTADPGNRHLGTAGAGVVVDGQDQPFGIDIEDDHVTVEWLEIVRFRGVPNEGAVTLSGGTGPTEVLLQNLLIHDFFDPVFDVSGIRLSGFGEKTVTIRNVMIWDGDENGIEGDHVTDVLTVENVSIEGMVDSPGRGIHAEASTVKVTNTIVAGSSTVDFDPGVGAFIGSSNTSSDATAPGPGAQTGVPAASVFVAPGADLHLKAAANPAVDSGESLLSASAFRGDIDGQVRPVGPQWDRGADELASDTPDLALTKDDGQATAVAGTPISYTITVVNNGPDPVGSVTVTDPVPATILGPSFTTLNGSYASGTGLWTFASPLLAGESAVLTLNGVIDPGATGSITNTATVTPPAGFVDTVPGNDSDSDVTTLTVSADLAIVKTDSPDPVDIGNPLTYTLTVTNNGPSHATGVVVTDTLAAELDYESATPSQGLCNFDGPTRTLSCSLGSLSASASATVSLVVRPLAVGDLVNTASVSGNEPDPSPGNDSASETTTVQTSSLAVRFFTVTSTFETNVLEWLNPSADYGSTEIVFRTDRFPTAPGEAGSTSIYNAGAAGAKDRFVHATGAGSNGQTYYYGAFVHRTVTPLVSPGRFCTGRPFDSSGPVKWAFSTGAFSITPPTVGGTGIVAPANDRALYAMERGPLGGEWPAGWLPAQLGGVVQSRSPIVPIPVNGSNPVVYLGAQDGSVYVVDGAVGGATAFPWAPVSIGGMVQAAPAGIFSAWGGAQNYLLVGTRDDGADNVFVALDPDTPGTVLGTFDNGGLLNGIGIISGMASVDYTNSRVYFASRESPTGSNGTLWCLQMGPPGPVFSLLWQRALQNIDSSPVLRGGRVYVGTTVGGGTVYSINAATGSAADDRTFVHGDGPVKGFVWPDRGGTDLFFATQNSVWGISDTGAPSMSNKFASGISLGASVTPSTVLLVPGSSFLYVGGSDGRLYEIDVAGAAPVVKPWSLGDGLALVGAPSYDWFHGLVHVGTEAGIFYAVQVPLP